ncbi:MAG TPA: hypothetical protein VFR41_08185 [Acidimicrobiia bacterium]|nr:hypothetical protein [Acidimicrobiia bacterium]
MSHDERWIDLHRIELHEVATRTGLHTDTVELVAALVLRGWTDDAIYAQLHAVVPSADGHGNPLTHVPAVLVEVRRLVAAS